MICFDPLPWWNLGVRYATLWILTYPQSHADFCRHWYPLSITPLQLLYGVCQCDAVWRSNQLSEFPYQAVHRITPMYSCLSKMIKIRVFKGGDSPRILSWDVSSFCLWRLLSASLLSDNKKMIVILVIIGFILLIFAWLRAASDDDDRAGRG